MHPEDNSKQDSIIDSDIMKNKKLVLRGLQMIGRMGSYAKLCLIMEPM